MTPKLNFKKCMAAIGVSLLMGYVLVCVAEAPAQKPPGTPSACQAAHDSANIACAEEMEQAWNDGGADNYPRRQHLRDLDICRRIADAALRACNDYEATK